MRISSSRGTTLHSSSFPRTVRFATRRGDKSHPHSAGGQGLQLAESLGNKHGSVPVPCGDGQTLGGVGLVNMAKRETFVVAKVRKLLRCQIEAGLLGKAEIQFSF